MNKDMCLFMLYFLWGLVMQQRGWKSLLKISTKGYNMIPIYARKEGKLTLLNITELTKWETNSVNYNIELTKG